MYKIKSNNGKVNSLLKTGKDLVKNAIPVSAAQHIIDTGEVVESDQSGYPIHVGEWYFEGHEVVEKKDVKGKVG